jgi:Regulator of ribonuclease activity B
MSIVENLMSGAQADIDVLRSMDKHGDDFSIARDVDFVFRAPAKEKAHTVIGFINDHQYGQARLEQAENEHRVLVTINMPIQQHAILSVSGFMSCVGALFGVDYDGWGCPVKRRA